MPSDTDGIELARDVIPGMLREGTEENEVISDADTGDNTEAPRLFGSLTPQEAGRRSAQARRERATSSEAIIVQEHADEVKLVRTTVPTGRIIQRLSKDAAGGNVQAARELRGWLAELPIETDTDLSALDRRTRQALLARLLLELEDVGEGDAEAVPSGEETLIATLYLEEALSPDATPPNAGTPVRPGAPAPTSASHTPTRSLDA